jgi:hypothetical protein
VGWKDCRTRKRSSEGEEEKSPGSSV